MFMTTFPSWEGPGWVHPRNKVVSDQEFTEYSAFAVGAKHLGES